MDVVLNNCVVCGGANDRSRLGPVCSACVGHICGNGGVSLPCSECPKNAVLYCALCQAPYCVEHDKSVHSIRALAGHERIPVNQAGEALKNIFPFCPHHQGEHLSLYCQQCNSFCCGKCKEFSLHSGHSFSPIENVLSVLKPEVGSLVEKLEPFASVNGEVSQASAVSYAGVVEKKREALRLEVIEGFKTIRKALEEREAKILDELSAVARECNADLPNVIGANTQKANSDEIPVSAAIEAGKLAVQASSTGFDAIDAVRKVVEVLRKSVAAEEAKKATGGSNTSDIPLPVLGGKGAINEVTAAIERLFTVTKSKETVAPTPVAHTARPSQAASRPSIGQQKPTTPSRPTNSSAARGFAGFQNMVKNSSMAPVPNRGASIPAKPAGRPANRPAGGAMAARATGAANVAPRPAASSPKPAPRAAAAPAAAAPAAPSKPMSKIDEERERQAREEQAIFARAKTTTTPATRGGAAPRGRGGAAPRGGPAMRGRGGPAPRPAAPAAPAPVPEPAAPEPAPVVPEPVPEPAPAPVIPEPEPEPVIPEAEPEHVIPEPQPEPEPAPVIPEPEPAPVVPEPVAEDPYAQQPPMEDPYAQQPPMEDPYAQQPPMEDPYAQPVDAPICGRCGQPITNPEENVSAFDEYYHMQCFVCEQCHNPLSESILELPDMPKHGVCSENCWYAYMEANAPAEAMQPGCAVCNGPLDTEYLAVGENYYHNTCFNCYNCHCEFENYEFYPIENKPYCRNCAEAVVAQMNSGYM